MDTPTQAVTDNTFAHEVLESLLPVVVDFWAPWCAPCRMLEPIFQELGQEYAGKYKFVRMSTDENSAVPTEYAIRSIPTLCIFRNGRMVDIILGARPKAFIKTKLDENLTTLNSDQEGGTELFSASCIEEVNTYVRPIESEPVSSTYAPERRHRAQDYGKHKNAAGY